MLKKYIARLYSIMRSIYLRLPMKVTSFGNSNVDVIYYVIHRNDEKVGLFSNVIVFLDEINYAINKGYVPVIDLKNYKNTYIYDYEVGVNNSWEYYFEQPLEYLDKNVNSLESAYNSCKVIINRGEWMMRGNTNFFHPDFLEDKASIDKWRKIYRQYVRLNFDTFSHINNQYSKLFSENDKVLGVFCRGTDYRRLMPHGHPVQPDVDDVISKVSDSLDKWGCNKIFLSTEDMSIKNQFISRFGDSVLSINRDYVVYDGGYITSKSCPRENDKFLQGLEYLTEIVILSRCNSIIGSSTSGMVGAILMSDGFENSYFYNLGLYK